MECPDSSSNVSLDEGQFQIPSLHPIHIFLWIVATAILISLDVAEDQTFGRAMPEVGLWSTNILHLINAMFLGAVFVAAGVLVRIVRLTSIDRLEPGHWLIINSTVMGILFFLLSTIWRYTANVAGEANSLLMIGSAVCVLVSAALFWFAATQLPDTEHWKGAFRIFALAHLFSVLAVIGLITSSTGNILSGIIFLALLLLLLLPACAFGIIALICFLSAVATDVRTKCHRDRLHWLGVATVIIFFLIRVVWSIARYLALP